jgi:integrase
VTAAALVKTPPAEGGKVLAFPLELVDQARTFAAAAKSPRTRDAYRLQWRTFATWCEGRGLEALPATPATLALFLTGRAASGIKPASLDVALAAITAAHKAAGHVSPRSSAEVEAVRVGIRRTMGTAPVQKAPILLGELRAMVTATPKGLAGFRDRALLLVGFAGGFRRSELVALEVRDLAFGADGLTIHLRRSKTDQEGEGRKVAIPYGSAPAPGTSPRRSSPRAPPSGRCTSTALSGAPSRGTTSPGS